MKHLRAWQRYEIAARLEAGYSKKEIAEYLHGFLSPDAVFSKMTGLDARNFV